MFDAISSRAVLTAPDVPALIDASWQDMRCPVGSAALARAVAPLLATQNQIWLDELGWDDRRSDQDNAAAALELLSGRNLFVILNGLKAKTDERDFLFGNPEAGVYGVLLVLGGWFEGAQLSHPSYTVYLARPDTSRMEAVWVWEKLPPALLGSVQELDRRPVT